MAFLACSSPTTVTSLVDSLHLAPSSYESLLKFFRRDSWNLEAVNDYLIHWVAHYAPLYTIASRNVLVGDGCKTPKQGKKLPTLKKMFIESEDVSKPNGFTPGLHFGAISLIGKAAGQLFSFPIFARLITGNKEVA